MSEHEPEIAEDADAQTEREANDEPDEQLEPDGDPDPDGEPEPDQDEQPQPHPAPNVETVTPEEIEKRAGQSRRAFEAFGRKLFTIHGEMAHDLIECPLCPDMHKGYFNIHDAGHVPDEIKSVVMQLLGLTRERDYEQLPGFETCATCKGEGKGATGSNVPGQTTVTCPACKGRGWRGPELAQGNGHVEHDPELSGPLVHGLETPTDDVDEWKEPRILPDGRENPNYGKMPHRKILVEPWGITAGLNALDAVQ